MTKLRLIVDLAKENIPRPISGITINYMSSIKKIRMGFIKP